MNIEHRVGPLTLRWQRGALKAARDLQPDVVIISGEVGTLSSWLIWAWARLGRKGRRVYFWTSAWEPQRPSSLSFRIKRLVLGIYFKLPDGTLVYSTRARNDMIDLGVPSERIAVCHNGVEVADILQRESEIGFAAAELRRVAGIGDRLLFLYVGRVIQGKALDLLITAFVETPACREGVLWIVGDGPELAALKAKADATGVGNIKFWGKIFIDVESYFAAADCFVLPGLGGLALNQAMVLGTPCICSVADGTEEDLVIDGVTGLRFLSGDVASLGDAMGRATELRAQGKLRRMGGAARGRVLETGTVDHMVETFLAAVR